MANASFVFGLRWVGSLSGGQYNGSVNLYNVAAGDGTALFLGDAVKSTGTAVTDPSFGVLPIVTQAAAGDTLRGVVVGFQVDPNNLNLIYRLASTYRNVFVVDDPFAIFEIQSNGTGVVGDVGANANIVVGSGDTITGLSGMQLNEGSVNVPGTTLQLRILRVYPAVDNAIGASVKYVVMINLHELKSVSGV